MQQMSEELQINIRCKQGQHALVMRLLRMLTKENCIDDEAKKIEMT